MGIRGRSKKAMWQLDPRLTKREGCIVMLIYRGLSNEAISKRLGIAKATVKAHIIHIFNKLDFTNRATLAGYGGYIIGYISKEKDALRNYKRRFAICDECASYFQGKMQGKEHGVVHNLPTRL